MQPTRGRSLDALRDEGKDKPLNWKDITPEELRPAVTAIRKAFDDASWRCRESARKLCFAGLHPVSQNQLATNPTFDVGPYKKYLIGAIGDRAREAIEKPIRTPPAIF